MGRLYYVRHGQTLFNVLRRKQGWCDSPLTEEGIHQARVTAAWLAERGIGFDHVYSSTSERACDTAEILAPGMPYQRVKGLKELNFGVFEGLTEDTNPRPPYGDFYVQFGGEGIEEMGERIERTLAQIMARPGHESVLAVGHGAALAQFLRMHGFEIMSTGRHLGNCCVAVFDFDGTGFTFVGLHEPNA